MFHPESEYKLIFFDVETYICAANALDDCGLQYTQCDQPYDRNMVFVECDDTEELMAIVHAFADGTLLRAGLVAKSVKADRSLGEHFEASVRQTVRTMQNERTLMLRGLPRGVGERAIYSACAGCDHVNFTSDGKSAFVRFVDGDAWRTCATLGCMRQLEIGGNIIDVAATRDCKENQRAIDEVCAKLRTQEMHAATHNGLQTISFDGSLEYYDWAVESLAPEQDLRVAGLERVPSTFRSVEHFCSSRVAFLCQEAQDIARSGKQKSGPNKRGFCVKMWSNGTRSAAISMRCLLTPPARGEEDYRSGEMLWLANERQLGIVTSTDDILVRGQVSAKVILGSWDETIDDDDEFHFDFVRLGSLLSLRRMFEALRELATSPGSMLFAVNMVLDQRMGGGDSRRMPPQGAIPVGTTLNGTQKSAALAALYDDDVRLSLLQGPPGSGKTTTVVTILQMLVRQHQPCIVCAPSNKALHEILERFVAKMPDVPVVCVGVAEKAKSEAVRDNLWERWAGAFYKRVDNIAATYAGLAKKKKAPTASLIRLIEHEEALAQFLRPSRTTQLDRGNLARITALQAFRTTPDELIACSAVVFVTLISSRRNALMRALAARPASYLIVDEAGQALESELLAPMYANLTDVLLVGDPRQLPATVISQQAQKLGFGKSAMERLGTSRHIPHRMLNTQYRMHSQINRWPSNQFYGGRLRAHSSLDARPVPWASSKQLRRLFGRSRSLFIDCKAEAHQKGTSRRNKAQVDVLKRVLDVLRAGGVDTVTECGIISPYLAQVQLIKQQLGKRVGACATVDGFQGGEFNIILISFVHHGAFVADAQRLNVAVTRARHALVMCGNVQKLRKQSLFDELIRSTIVTKEFDKQERRNAGGGDDNVNKKIAPPASLVDAQLRNCLKSKKFHSEYGFTATKLCTVFREQTGRDLLNALAITIFFIMVFFCVDLSVTS